ncbi:MAG: GNAT family N-acetyltransferase, partial [Phycisphaerae bacterium]|nr:GNAT family N-acetyltransferase [Phycisphaerae bacterium]
MSIARRIEFTFDPARADAEAMHAVLRTSYWSPGIRRDVVEAGARHSIVCTGWLEGKLVAIARIVTDRATLAYLCDIWVHPELRGTGVGTAIVRHCEAHPDLQTVRRWLLATRDAQGLYARLGYRPVDARRWMERPMPAERWQEPAANPAEQRTRTEAAAAIPLVNEFGQPSGPPIGTWCAPADALRQLRDELRGQH